MLRIAYIDPGTCKRKAYPEPNIRMTRIRVNGALGMSVRATVIIFFVSRHIKTPKATRLGEKNNLGKKKKGSSAPHKLKQFWRQCVPGIEWMFFFATLWDNVAFLQPTYINTKNYWK